MRTAPVTPKNRKVLSAEELSSQQGIYFRGKAPGGEVPTLWQYSHATSGKAHGTRYWFQDCMQSAEEEPFLVPFRLPELKLLRRV